ncbi:hypothetical protein OG689_20605 [Kitasatospora sp. NBC_00240]|uniref:hypothetical protein n=1 Tax=Kitasatospora sp. NBC_00240 TaxID=2903567 RepID=UPI0022519382|nr:hypothetical protein [Kitasatospora sp. NBC_00240]MCX5211662.1 hypothetical protein [Kitasatospora sp. NBC_00240]
MASIIVLLELEPSTEVLDEGEVDVGARVRWVHAAAGDPDVPEDPAPRTFCGIDTAPLEYEPYRPSGPGEPWYPPLHRTRRCRDCETALRSL